MTDHEENTRGTEPEELDDRIEPEVPEDAEDIEDMTEETVAPEETADSEEFADFEEINPGDPPKRPWGAGKIVAAVLSAVLIIGVGVLAYILMVGPPMTYAMKFDGQKVPIEDYELMLQVTSGSEDQRQMALDILTNLQVYNKAAQQLGIALTDEEVAEIVTSLPDFRSYYAGNGIPLPEISDERLTAILTMDSYYGKILDAMLDSYVVDEADYTAALAAYKENSRAEYADLKFKYVITETLEDAEAAAEAFRGGLSVDEVIAQYSLDYVEGEEPLVMSLKEVQLSQEMTSALFSLPVGGMTQVFDMNGMSVIFWVAEMTIPTDDEISSGYRGQYEQEKVYEKFETEMASIEESSKIEINEDALDAALARALALAAAPSPSPSPVG